MVFQILYFSVGWVVLCIHNLKYTSFLVRGKRFPNIWLQSKKKSWASDREDKTIPYIFALKIRTLLHMFLHVFKLTCTFSRSLTPPQNHAVFIFFSSLPSKLSSSIKKEEVMLYSCFLKDLFRQEQLKYVCTHSYNCMRSFWKEYVWL